MGMKVHISNETEQLLEALVDALADQKARRGGLEPVDLVVPNNNMASWVKFSLAEHTGIAANLRVRFMEKYVRDQARRLKSELKIIDRGLLTQLVLSVLLDDGQLGEIEVLERYVHQASTPEGAERRRVQLAQKLAGLYEEYTFSRPELIERWTMGGGAGSLDWQGELWRRMFGQTGLVAERSKPEQESWITVAQLFDHITPEAFGDTGPLHVFGVSYVASVFHDFMRRVSEVMDVHVYALNPCPEYRGQTGELPVADPGTLAPIDEAVDPDGEDPFGLVGDEPCLPLRYWARPGRENVRLLCGGHGVRMQPRFVDPGAGSDTLLHRLQSRIVRRVPHAEPETASSADGSIQLIGCKGVHREVEAISDEIWRRVHDDRPDGPPLRFNDIAVIVNPAQRDAYTPHIESVFAQNHAIPHNIVDLDFMASSPVAQLASLLMALPEGRFSRPQMGRVLGHPAFVARDLEVDGPLAATLCDELNVYFGADRADHDETYIERDVFNWDQAVRRIALGALMTGERSGEIRGYELGPDSYLPHEMGPSRGAAAGTVALLVRSLIADVRFAREAELPLSRWADFISAMLRTYTRRPTPDDSDLYRCLSAVNTLREVDLGPLPVSWTIASQLVTRQLDTLRGSRGQHLADGVVVSTFMPMRAIPFRVVFVTGMGEGRFPRGERRDTLDLRASDPRAGDVGPAEQDRYTFLETLLCTRDALVMTWISRDPLTGDPLTASPVIRELTNALRPIIGEAEKSLTKNEPLRNHDVDPQDPGTFIEQSVREARLLAIGDALRLHTGQLDAAHDEQTVRALLGQERSARLTRMLGLSNVPPTKPRADGEVVELTLAALRWFLQCPLQGSARAVLGLHEHEDDDTMALGDEPLEPGYIQAIVLLREAMVGAIARGQRVERVYDTLAEQARRAGDFPMGPFGKKAREDHLAVLAGWQNLFEQDLGGLPEQLSVVRFGRAEEFAEVQTIEPAIELPVTLPDSTRVSVRLSGRTGLLLEDPSSSVVLKRGAPPKPHLLARHHMGGYVDHLVLAASALTENRSRLSVVVTTDGQRGRAVEHALAPLSRQEALEQLSRIVSDLLGQVHDVLMPCEAVHGWALSHDSSFESWVDSLQSPYSPRFSSLFGPVPRPLSYTVPDEDTARAIVERRYEPYLRSFLDTGDGS